MSEFIDELKTLCRQGGIEAGQDVLERMEEYYECMKAVSYTHLDVYKRQA